MIAGNPEPIRVKIHSMTLSEILRQWLIKNVGEQFLDWEAAWTPSFNDAALTILFKRIQDATHFILVHGGVIEK